jgi:hypothetical protein
MLNLSSECDRPAAISIANEAVQGSQPAGAGGRILWAGLLVVLLLVLPVAAQNPRLSQPDIGDAPPRDDSGAGLEPRMEAKRIHQLNQMRQKAMVSDAEKLLRLARELNDDANAGGANLSNAERVHKAGEIEKLAKGVREKMTYAAGEPREIPSPFAIYPR